MEGRWKSGLVPRGTRATLQAFSWRTQTLPGFFALLRYDRASGRISASNLPIEMFHVEPTDALCAALPPESFGKSSAAGLERTSPNP